MTLRVVLGLRRSAYSSGLKTALSQYQQSSSRCKPTCRVGLCDIVPCQASTLRTLSLTRRPSPSKETGWSVCPRTLRPLSCFLFHGTNYHLVHELSASLHISSVIPTSSHINHLLTYLLTYLKGGTLTAFTSQTTRPVKRPPLSVTMQ